MEGKITQLTERGTGTPMWPQTLAEGVLMKNGWNAEDAIAAAARQSFVDRWRLRGGNCDDAGVEFALNGLTGITYEQAIIIEASSPWQTPQYRGSTSDMELFNGLFWGQSLARTFFLPLVGKAYNLLQVYSQNMFYGCRSMEVTPDLSEYTTGCIHNMFYGCSKLREVTGTIRCHPVMDTIANTTFHGCTALEEIRLNGTPRRATVNFSDCPRLSSASVKYLVETAYTATDAAPTVILHPDLYAKLTDETNAEWSAVLAKAAEKNITFATL